MRNHLEIWCFETCISPTCQNRGLSRSQILVTYIKYEASSYEISKNPSHVIRITESWNRNAKMLCRFISHYSVQIARSTWWIWLAFYNDRIPKHHNRRGTCYSKSVNKIKYDMCICTLAINMLFYSCARSSQFGYICITTYMIFQRCVFPLLHTKLMTANFFFLDSTTQSILYEHQPAPSSSLTDVCW